MVHLASVVALASPKGSRPGGSPPGKSELLGSRSDPGSTGSVSVLSYGSAYIHSCNESNVMGERFCQGYATACSECSAASARGVLSQVCSAIEQ